MTPWQNAAQRCMGFIDSELANLDDPGRAALLNALGERYQLRLEHIAEELGPMDVQNLSTLAELEGQPSEASRLLAEGLKLMAEHRLQSYFTDWPTRVRALLVRTRAEGKR